MKNNKKIESIDALLDSCISYSDLVKTSDEVSQFVNYYSKFIDLITYAKLMIRDNSLTPKGLQRAVLVLALPIGENENGEIIFSINEAQIQESTAKNVNKEISKIHRNSLKSVSFEERFYKTESLIISEIREMQENISRLGSSNSLNIGDNLYTWNEYSELFESEYGYVPEKFNFETWREYKKVRIDTRALNWKKSIESDFVPIDQDLQSGARSSQGMTMNELLQPTYYDLEPVTSNTQERINVVEEIEPYDENGNLNIEAFMKPTIQKSYASFDDNNNYDYELETKKPIIDVELNQNDFGNFMSDDEQAKSSEMNFDLDIKDEKVELDTQNLEEREISSKFENTFDINLQEFSLTEELQNTEATISTPESDLEEIQVSQKDEKNLDNNEELTKEAIIADIVSSFKTYKPKVQDPEIPEVSIEDIDKEDLFSRVKCIRYEPIETDSSIDDDFFERLGNSLESTSRYSK